jgi:hypothetical protein
MGQQIKKVLKRSRRKKYLSRKKELIKLGGFAKKVSVVKKPTATGSATESKPTAKKAPAKKAAKKAPAKKAAKSVDAEVETTEEKSAE